MPSSSRIVPRSCGCTPSTTNDTRLAFSRAVPMMREAANLAQDARARDRAARARGRARRRDRANRGSRPPRRDRSRSGDVRRAGLELVGQGVVGRLLEADREDHVAAALPRRHPLEQRLAAVEHADAGRREQLVPGEGVEIASRAPARRRPCAAPPGRRRAESRCRAPAPLAISRSTGSTVPRAFETCAHARIRVRAFISASTASACDFAARVDRRDDELRAGLLRSHLPRHDVRVMLEVGDQDLVAGDARRPREALRDQVDRLGRAAHEHDLVAGARVDERRQPVARRLVEPGRFLAQGVHAAVDVRVVAPHRSRRPRRSRSRGAAPRRRCRGTRAGSRARSATAPEIRRARARGRTIGARARVPWCSSEIPQELASPAAGRSARSRSRAAPARDDMPVSTSARNANTSRLCAVARSRPRDSR